MEAAQERKREGKMLWKSLQLHLFTLFFSLLFSLWTDLRLRLEAFALLFLLLGRARLTSAALDLPR